MADIPEYRIKVRALKILRMEGDRMIFEGEDPAHAHVRPSRFIVHPPSSGDYCVQVADDIFELWGGSAFEAALAA